MALTMYIVITSFFHSRHIQIIRLGTSYCGHWMDKTHKIMNISRNVYVKQLILCMHIVPKKRNIIMYTLMLPWQHSQSQAFSSSKHVLLFLTPLPKINCFTLFSRLNTRGVYLKTTSHRPIYLNPAFIWVLAFIKRGIFHRFDKVRFWPGCILRTFPGRSSAWVSKSLGVLAYDRGLWRKAA